MYVKIYNKILDSSIAENRPLRHFFMDLLLCSDPDGNVLMTKKAIAKRIGATEEEVEWGLTELMKPDEGSLNLEFQGRRVIPLEGHGYGWKLVSYEQYRDIKNGKALREQTAERVRRWREKQKTRRRGKPGPGENLARIAADNGGDTGEVADAVNAEMASNREDAAADI